MYVRSKKVKRTSRKRQSGAHSYPADTEYYTYYQLVRGYRNEEGKPRQEVVAHLGRNPTPEEALEQWDKQAAWARRHAADHQHAAEYIRSGRAGRVPRSGGGYGKRLVPRSETPLDSDPPARGGFAPRGWFYSGAHIPYHEEALAQEYTKRAEGYEKRAAHLRSVL